jgi:hypothetical protein
VEERKGKERKGKRGKTINKENKETTRTDRPDFKFVSIAEQLLQQVADRADLPAFLYVRLNGHQKPGENQQHVVNILVGRGIVCKRETERNGE